MTDLGALTPGCDALFGLDEVSLDQDGPNAYLCGCTCFAAVDAIDSDLRFVNRYYKSATVAGSGSQCAQACDSWRRDWFYRDACDNPTRINRGMNASWGYSSAREDTLIGPATWWCPFPPP